MKNKPDGIDEALGLDEPALPTTIVMDPSPGLTTTGAEDDLEYARRNIREVIEHAKEAVAVMGDTVAQSGDHKSAESYANLLDKFVNANERLVNLVKKPAGNVANPNGEGASKVVNNTQNVVLVGSANDMLKMMNKYRGEEDIEDSLEDER